MRSSLYTATLAILAGTLTTIACTKPLPDEGPMPELSGAETWFNAQPLTKADLKGRVVLIDFWTYSCVNCLRVLPYVKAWEAKYRDRGLVVIGVHAPEFDFEEDTINVKAAMQRLGITYPVVLDNDMKIWEAFKNKFWPAHYFIDVHGRIRYHHFGEGGYDDSERVIRRLLTEVPASNRVVAGKMPSDEAVGRLEVTGVGAPPDVTKGRSPETYVGYLRADRMKSTPAIQREGETQYTPPSILAQHEWALSGLWFIAREYGETRGGDAAIQYQFFGRDVNLVLGIAPGSERASVQTGAQNRTQSGIPVRFRITIDGKAPGEDAGMDVDANGYGMITEHRMYQLFRHKNGARRGTFVITFEGPGARAYAFTFG